MAHDAKQQPRRPEDRDSARWSEEITRVDRRGGVYVRLASAQRSLLLRVSAPGADARVLMPGRFGDVSYTEVIGFAQAAAADCARAYAVQLGAGGAALPRHLPHLAVAAVAGRTPGSCRATVAELWPRDVELPAARAEVRLDPSGLMEFLAPELRLDVGTSDGFTLRGVHLASADHGAAGCVLEFEPPAEAQVSNPTLIDIGTLENGSEIFGAVQLVSVALRPGGAEHDDSLALAVARLCSWLVALIELKQSPDFTVRQAERATIAASVPARHSRSIEPSAPAARDSRSTAVSSKPGGPGAQHAASPVYDADMQAHRFNLLASGFTVLPQVLPPTTVAALAADVDRALEATRAAVAAGRQLAYTFYDEATYLGTRCVYCWGDACSGLLENDAIRRVAESVIGAHRLFDMSALRALPAAPFASRRTEWWHRDIDVSADSPQNVRYLWFFVLLDDFTADNGATWVVPGSQRIPNAALPKKKHFPTSMQLLGRAGDVMAINPSALHTVGHNITDRPRTMINVSICHADVRPLMDHWSIAGPAIQAQASQRLRQMLGAEDRPLDTSWSVLPEGWISATRSTDESASERILPTEQQGYQRQHHMRDGLLLPDRPGNRDGDQDD